MIDSCKGCNHIDVFSYKCKHRDLNEDAVVNNIEEYYHKDTAPVWCPLIIKIDQVADSNQVNTGKTCPMLGKENACGPDICSMYFGKQCPHEDEVTKSYNPNGYKCKTCPHEYVEDFECGHPQLLSNIDNGDTKRYNLDGCAPTWCPRIRLDKQSAPATQEADVGKSCYSLGDPKECHPDICERYFGDECPHEVEVTKQYNPNRHNCRECLYESKTNYKCEHPRLLNNVDGGETPRYHRKGLAPTWCPRIRLDEKTKQNNSRRKEMKEMKEDKVKFDFDTATAQVKGNAVNAVDTIKNTLITMQKGKAVITAVKASLMKAPGCPDGLKVLLATPYGDMVVGLILHTAAPVITGSPTILKAVKAANVAGAVELSQSITFIQDAIENAIGALPGFDEVKKMTEDKIDKAVGTDYTDTKTDGRTDYTDTKTDG